MRFPAALTIIALTALLGLLVLACREEPKPAPAPVAKPPLPAAPGLFVFGNEQGMIRPCGCSKPVLGGIVRRGAFFAALPGKLRADSTLLAVGSLIHEGGRQQELKLEAFLDSAETLGAAIVLPGEHDLLVGSRFWTDLLYQRPEGATPIVAGNVLLDGVPLFASSALVERAGRQVAVTSWLWPESGVISEPGVELAANPDLAGLEAILADERGEARDLVLFTTAPEPIARAWLDENGLRDRAARVLVLVAGPSDLPMIAVQEEDYLVVEVGQKGRDLARLDWPAGPGLESFELVEAYGGNEAQQKILDFYRGNVRHEELILQAPKFERSEDAYAGSEACAVCHAEAHAIWKESRHAHAFATLLRVGDDRDPECVRCHVVDFFRQGGFDPVSVEPVDVQCEACHGPAASHVEDPARPTPRPELGDRDCRICHDLANSPRYDFASYWPKIAHGK